MSYPSIVKQLTARNLDLNHATEAQMEDALFAAFETDLPLGTTFLRQQAAEANRTGKRLLHAEDPNSPLGKQIIRLLGTDVPRAILERRFEVAFGFYNCCSTVVAPTREELNLSLKEQIMLQNGDLASADC